MWHLDGVVVPEGFQIAQQIGQVVVVGWDEGGVGQGGPAHPILTAAELARSFALAAHPLQGTLFQVI
ncbi:MAG: hypothetical protein HQL96_03575 [Magnetococcales bacterium]|nr:hypothetical protein [Magnetococcales bacterium]